MQNLTYFIWVLNKFLDKINLRRSSHIKYTSFKKWRKCNSYFQIKYLLPFLIFDNLKTLDFHSFIAQMNTSVRINESYQHNRIYGSLRWVFEEKISASIAALRKAIAHWGTFSYFLLPEGLPGNSSFQQSMHIWNSQTDFSDFSFFIGQHTFAGKGRRMVLCCIKHLSSGY